MITRQFSLGLNRSKSSVRVMTWNCLADQCADASDCGFKYVDPSILDFEHRLPLIVKEINDNCPDIFALQEVDRVEEIKDMLPNYDCVYYNGESNRHGLLIGYNDEWKLQNVIQKRFVVDDQPTSQALMICDFINTVSGCNITFATTHLKAKPGFEMIRLAQGQQLLEELRDKNNVIVVGDFNDVPESPVHSLFKNNYTSVYNAHSASDASDSEYTTIKVRPKGGEPVTAKKIIDYIWHDSCFNVSSTLIVPDVSSLTWPYLPCGTYPSDHFSLVAELLVH